MKLQSSAAIPNSHSHYRRRYPFWFRWITYLAGSLVVTYLAIFLVIQPKPPGHSYRSPQSLYNSKPRSHRLDLSRYSVSLSKPVDHQSKYYGEKVAENSWVKPQIGLLKQPPAEEIQQKIETDMAHFGALMANDEGKDRLAINTTVDLFYPEVSGHAIDGWRIGWWTFTGNRLDGIGTPVLAKVRLYVNASVNGATVISKYYQSFYSSAGLFGYEGSEITSLQRASNVTLGITLRKTLDQFYRDLAKGLRSPVITRHWHNVLFAAGSPALGESSERDLSSVIDFMKANPKIKVELDGYTDTLGDVFKDQELSDERVKVVKSFLTHHGIRPRRIRTKGFGPTRPVSADPSEEGRRLNRRVEISILKGKT